jgi:dCTP deaminase
MARVEGKSTLGRIFLAVHITAGFIDPGFNGKITLEVVNHGPWNLVLWPGMKIAQISFSKMSKECSKPYGSLGLKSHYQGQNGVTAASSWIEKT